MRDARIVPALAPLENPRLAPRRELLVRRRGDDTELVARMQLVRVRVRVTLSLSLSLSLSLTLTLTLTWVLPGGAMSKPVASAILAPLSTCWLSLREIPLSCRRDWARGPIWSYLARSTAAVESLCQPSKALRPLG